MIDSTEEIVAQIERLGRLARSAQHAEGMKPAQWEALRYLLKARKQSRNPGALADFLSSTRGTVSQTLIALEKKGLVERLNCASDGRAKRLELTQAGHALMLRDPLKNMSDAVAALGDNSGLAEYLEGVVHTLVEQNGTNDFGNCYSCRHFKTDVSGGACGLMALEIDANDMNQLCRDFEATSGAHARMPSQSQGDAVTGWLS